jgi:hypothetical protein
MVYWSTMTKEEAKCLVEEVKDDAGGAGALAAEHG